MLIKKNLSCCLKENQIIIMFVHSNILTEAAGVEKYVLNEINLLNKHGIGAVVVFPLRNSDSFFDRSFLTNYYGVIYNNKIISCLDKRELVDEINGLNNYKIHVLEIHLHHTKNYDIDDLQWILSKIDGKIKYFIHDFYSVCKSGIMLKNNMNFCGLGPVSREKCYTCKFYGTSVKYAKKMHLFIKSLLPNLEVIGPSESTKKIWMSVFGDLGIEFIVIPHLKIEIISVATQEKSLNCKEKIKIAFAGAPISHKGWHEFVDITNEIKSEYYEFYHFGVEPRQTGNWQEKYVTYLDGGKNAMIDALKEKSIDMVLLLTHCAETYCYTLYESICAHTWIIALKNSGNVEDTVHKYECGRVFENLNELYGYLNNVQAVRDDVSNNKKFWNQKDTVCSTNDELLKHISREIHEDSNKVETSRLKLHPVVNAVYRLKMCKRNMTRGRV